MKIYFYTLIDVASSSEKGLHHFVQTRSYFATYNTALNDIQRHLKKVVNDNEEIIHYFVPMSYYEDIYHYLNKDLPTQAHPLTDTIKPSIDTITPRPSEQFNKLFNAILIDKIIEVIVDTRVNTGEDKEEAEIIAYTDDKKELVILGADYCQKLLKDCQLVEFIGLFDEIANGGTFHFYATKIEHFVIAGIKLILKKFKRDNHNILNNTVEYDYGLIQAMTIVYNKRLVFIDFIDEQTAIVYISKVFYENDFQQSMTHNQTFITEINQIAKREVLKLYAQRLAALRSY